MPPDLSNKAMLIGLSISQFSGNKLDRNATKKVTEDYGNKQDSARVHKSIIARDALKEIASAANEARTMLYKRSLPWRDDGKRILTAMEFLPLTADMRVLESKFWTAVTAFCDNYQDYKDRAKIDLNGLYQESDYPDVAKIRAKFSFAVSVDPLPTAQDFRVNLQAAEVSQIQQQIEQRLNDATAEAMRDLWQRLYTAVSNTVERLSQPDAVFRDSLIGNMQELVDLLPRLNLTDDAELEACRQEVRDKLLRNDPQVLRDNKEERAETARDAQNILDAMAAFMGVS